MQHEVINQNPNFSILSPQTDWVYYTDSVIILATNIRSGTVEWSSSKDGYLGNGNGINVSLSEGIHVVSATGQSGTKTIRFYVGRRNNSDYDYRNFLVTNISREIFFPKGEYITAIFSLNGSAKNIELKNEETTSPAHVTPYSRMNIYSDKADSLPLRNFQINHNAFTNEPDSTRWFKNLNPSKKIIQQESLLRTNEIEKDFFVINTENQFEIPHTIRANIIHSGEKWVLWQDSSHEQLSQDVLQACIENIEQLVIPRAEILWGEWADIDGDGKIAILLSPTINEEKVAIGFFNPADLFTNDTDKNSESYNPYSNEMDIVYVAVPDTTESGNYSIPSISATIAHELTHAITFNKKTFSHIVTGNANRTQEELFLDEGWSHLSETLCGFGISGGNIHFFDMFLDNTGAYSFCSDNMYGQGDSAERRGAMTLFLSWLFWKAGGMTWDDKYLPVDLGGIQFLQNMLKSDIYGWESIGAAFGKPTDILFADMIYELSIQESKGNFYNFKKDPKTNDPVEFFTYMGELAVGENIVSIAGANVISDTSSMTVLPWSLQFYKTIECADDTRFLLEASDAEGHVYIGSKKK